MGLISVFNNAEKAHDSKKDDYKAFLVELTDDPLSKAEKEKMTTDSLLLMAEVSNLKKKMTRKAQAVFQLYANLVTEEAHQPWDVIIKE